MFRSASLFIGTSFTVAVFTIFATSNVDSIVGIPHKIYSMQRILIHIKTDPFVKCAHLHSGYAAHLVARSRYYHCHWTLLMSAFITESEQQHWAIDLHYVQFPNTENVIVVVTHYTCLYLSQQSGPLMAWQFKKPGHMQTWHDQVHKKYAVPMETGNLWCCCDLLMPYGVTELGEHWMR